jgi:hypothetical protein
MSKDIVTVHLRLTKDQHEKLKDRKGNHTWEEYVLDMGGLNGEITTDN